MCVTALAFVEAVCVTDLAFVETILDRYFYTLHELTSHSTLPALYENFLEIKSHIKKCEQHKGNV